MSALIPALIQLALSGRGRGGGGGGGYSRGGGGGYGRGGGRGRQPFDPQEDLDKKAGQFLHGGGRRNPFGDNYPKDDESDWDRIYAALGGEVKYPKAEIPDDIYEEEDE